MEISLKDSKTEQNLKDAFAGIDHDNYNIEVSPVADDIRRSLLNDLI